MSSILATLLGSALFSSIFKDLTVLCCSRETVRLLVHAQGAAIVSSIGGGWRGACVVCVWPVGVCRRAGLLGSQFVRQTGCGKNNSVGTVFLRLFKNSKQKKSRINSCKC